MALIDKASLLMVPSVYEDGTLYNVLPSGNKAPDETGNHNGYDQTRADFTFSRGSNLAATRVNADGLIEKGRENVLLQSNSFSTSPWDPTSLSLSSGQIGYDGSNNAWLITKPASSYVRLRQNIVSTGVLVASIYAKANTLTQASIYAFGTTNATAKFNLLDGSIITSTNTIDANAVSVGDGWYRLSITFNSSTTQIAFYPDFAEADAGSIYIQNAQLEAGLVATDYIETGATTATAGVLENTPRIDYSSGAGALLLEPQRTNIVTSSEYVSSNDYVVANWTGTITTNTTETTSPEGVYNATKYVKSGASDRVYFHSSQPDGAYTGSVWLKAASGSENTTIEISVRRFGGGGGSTSKLVTITNEWQRFDVTATNLTGGTTTAMYVADFSMGGTATEFYSYGMQIEAGTYPSSYVPTYGSAATRGADSCSVTGVSDVIGQTEGTIYWEGIAQPNDNPILVQLIPSAAGNYTNTIYLEYVHSSTEFKVQAWDTGVKQVQINTGAVTAGQVYKLAFAYKANDFALYMNGTQIGTDTSGSVQSGLDKIGVGSLNGTTNAAFYGSEAKQLVLFNERLSNPELAALTA